MDEELTQFISDAREIVEKLYHDLEQLRSARTQGRQRRELAARIFRRVHTLKGSAGSLGLKAVSQIARALESEATEETSPGATGVIRQLTALAAESKKQGTIAGTLRAALPPEIA